MKYEDLLVYVLPEVPSCPNFTAVQALRDSAIEFCVKTDAYHAELEPVDVQAAVWEYDLPAPSGTEINHVLRLLRKIGTVYEALTPIAPQDYYLKQGEGQPKYFTQTASNLLLLAPTPQEVETLYAQFTLKPSQASIQIPDAVAKENTETLVHGALYRLLMMQDKPWTNVGSAGNNKKMYDQQLALAMRRIRQGYSGGVMSVAPRRFV